MDASGRTVCRECGGTRFFQIASSAYAGEGGDHSQFITRRAEALFDEGWLEALVCRECGNTVFRVANLKRLERIAANPDSGIVPVESPEPSGPFR